jgi:hypothetical protein
MRYSIIDRKRQNAARRAMRWVRSEVEVVDVFMRMALYAHDHTIRETGGKLSGVFHPAPKDTDVIGARRVLYSYHVIFDFHHRLAQGAVE